jgi:amidase
VGSGELTLASAEAQLAALRAREVSSEELTSAYLERIGQHNPELNAIVSVDEVGALDRARRCDEETAAGADVGPLHGLPMTIKDGWEVSGIRSTAGIPALHEYVPDRDAEVVARIRRAGAVIVGKTNIPTANADFQTSNPVFGRTNNPWDHARTPGGSCGGGGAAVASGITGLELGSEIGGSLRLPAHFTGIYGHKTSFGLAPTTNHLPPAPDNPQFEPDLVVPGGMARGAGDLEVLVRTIAGPSHSDAVAWRLDLPGPRARELRDFRIAVWFDDPFVPLDAEVAAVFSDAVAALRGAGAKLDLTPPIPASLKESHRVYEALLFGAFSIDRSTYSARGTAYFLRSVLLHPRGQAPRTMKLIRQRHEQWLRQHMKRLEIRERWRAFFRDYDAVLMPVTASVAPPHHGKDHDRFGRTYTVNGEARDYFEQPVWSGVANLIGSPATALPAGLGASGLPVGMQILGPIFEDLTVIQLARKISAEIGGYMPPQRYATKIHTDGRYATATPTERERE